jgi:hypothetical protein
LKPDKGIDRERSWPSEWKGKCGHCEHKGVLVAAVLSEKPLAAVCGYGSNQHHTYHDGHGRRCGEANREKYTTDRFAQCRHKSMPPAGRETKDSEKLPRGVKPWSPKPSQQFLRAMRCQSESYSQSQKQKPDIHKILYLVSFFHKSMAQPEYRRYGYHQSKR